MSGEVPATIATSAGDITMTLDAEAAPCTVDSFVSLADQGYFDDTTCHRLTTQGIFVLQCGDPTGTGTGGPGYSFADELAGRETYRPARSRWRTPAAGHQRLAVLPRVRRQPAAAGVHRVRHLDDAGLEVVREIAESGTADGGPRRRTEGARSRSAP